MLQFCRFHVPAAAERPVHLFFFLTLWLLRAQVN